MNKLALTGRLASIPQLKFFDSGKCLCTFAIAVNQGQDRPAHFFDCEAWQQTAEALQHAQKGDEVSILGSLTQQRWNDKATGKERSKVVVNCWQAAYFSKVKGTPKPTPQTKTHGGNYAEMPF